MAIYLNPEAIEKGSISIEKLSPTIQNVINSVEPPVEPEVQPNNEIWYTTSDNSMVGIHFGGEGSGNGVFTEDDSMFTFGAIMTNHTYLDGRGVISFDNPVTCVGDWAFMDQSKLVSIQLPSTVTYCGWYAFKSCNLNTFTVHSNIEWLGESVLQEFNGTLIIESQQLLTDYVDGDYPNGPCVAGGSSAWLDGVSGKIIIAEGITSIGEYVFKDLSTIEEIDIPSTVVSISSNAFEETTCKIIFKSSLVEKNYSASSEPFACFNSNGNQSIHLVIGDNIKHIGEYAFTGSIGLKKVEIPDSVSSIGVAAFWKCSNLQEVSIGNGCTSIGASAFSKCYIKQVSIGSGIKSIGNYAFSNNSLDSGHVVCLANTPPVLSNAHVFSTGGTRPICVPSGSVSAYKKATNWSYYAGTIVSANDREQFITWSELKKLRDSGGLVPGKQYRITDYFTTVHYDPVWDDALDSIIHEETEISVADHQFDVIVIALTSDTLSENASAALSLGDTYFKNSNISSWKLWYCLDNDKSRFIWADTVRGKGVIYRMIDQSGNDCPYDFKNVQFKYRYLNYENGEWNIIQTSDWVYTFTYRDDEAWTIEDYSVVRPVNCFGNIIKGKPDHTYSGAPRAIPYIVFSNNLKTNACYKNYIEAPQTSSENMSNIRTNHIVFGNGAHNNTVGRGCFEIYTSGSCYNNKFDTAVNHVYLGSKCHTNSFGTHTQKVYLGENCMANSFEHYCNTDESTIKFGDSCHYNTVGRCSKDLVFGTSCSHNTLEDSDYSITLNDNCDYNFFGAHVQNVTLDAESKYKRYMRGIDGDVVSKINELLETSVN